MPYRFLDDAPTADVGFVATGATLDECFGAAAEALLTIMLGNPDALTARQRISIHTDGDAVDLALLRFLEEFIYRKDTDAAFFRPVRVAVTRQAAGWTVDAIADGEPIDRARHLLGADVKAVTLHRLQVRQTDDGWEATVVLDI